MNKPSISHNREDETDEAKSRWFQSLSIEERMDYFCMMTDFLLESNPKVKPLPYAQSITGSIRVLSEA